MTHSPLSHNLTRSFGLLLALLLFLVGFAMFNFRALSEANQLNIHTYQVINSTLELEATLFAVDSGARGYLVTGDKNALTSYRSNLEIYQQRLNSLWAITNDNPIQVANLSTLDALKKRWTNGLIEPLFVQRQLTTDPQKQVDIAVKSTPQRRQAFKNLQKVTTAIETVEQKLLLERTEDQKRAKWWTQFTLLTGAAFSTLLTVFLVSFASKSVRQLDRTNRLLREAKISAESTSERLLEINEQLANEILARHAADEKLRRSVLDLQRSNAELEQFAYVASHDLQEPLRAVGGCVQVLQRRYEGKLDARADQFIQHAVDGAQRMQNLINDLLAYSRVGSKTKPLKPVEGTEIVAAVMQNTSVARLESEAQITVDAMPILVCDAGQIEQVLQNLLSNAIKFRGDAPPRIHIGYATRIENDVPFHVLSVEDGGLGIDPQYFERIFVMFQRLHTRTEYAGTGIGLAICKKIIERHGGKIWVESWRGETEQEPSPGAKRGSKFSFSLPFEPELQAKEEKDEADPPQLPAASEAVIEAADESVTGAETAPKAVSPVF